jgi:hypothetical protein
MTQDTFVNHPLATLAQSTGPTAPDTFVPIPCQPYYRHRYIYKRPLPTLAQSPGPMAQDTFVPVPLPTLAQSTGRMMHSTFATIPWQSSTVAKASGHLSSQ